LPVRLTVLPPLSQQRQTASRYRTSHQQQPCYLQSNFNVFSEVRAFCNRRQTHRNLHLQKGNISCSTDRSTVLV
jgi:hypothetical protein